MQSCDTLAALNLTFSQRFGLGSDTPIFMASPLGHSVGAYHGSRLSLFNASPLILQERWDPDTAIALIRDYGCVFTAAATPFLDDLINARRPNHGDKLATLRWFLCGGAQVPPSLIDRAGDEFPQTRVTVLWGMTEGGLTTCHADSSREKFRSTCGIGLPGLELHTVDERGDAQSAGVKASWSCGGPAYFWLSRPAGPLSIIADEDEYFRTGDLANNR